MKITRTQWPVGQGCFASGVIKSNNNHEINYVYDCGARNITHMKPIILNYVDSVNLLDIIFVSHLDGDHVDGLDFLLSKLSVKDVVLPYLNEYQKFIKIMEAEQSGELSNSLAEALFDPLSWFGSRGAEQVILLQNGESDDEIKIEEPKGPLDKVDGKEKVILIPPTLETKSEKSDGMKSKLFLMKVGEAYKVINGGTGTWMLLPYVPAVASANIDSFKKKIKDVLGLKSSDEIKATDLLNKLKNKDGRKKLRECYNEIIKDGAERSEHNKVSMSLYSGPSKQDKEWTLVHNQWSSNFYPFHRCYQCSEDVGWIGNGDAKLKDDITRKEWISFYDDFRKRISSLLIPHHGSKANWHSELISETSADIFIAAADEQTTGYKHPSVSVVFEIQDAGRWPIHVSKDLNSRFIEHIMLIKP